GRLETDLPVSRREAPVECRDQIAPLPFRDRREVLLPGVRKEMARPLLVEPAELGLTEEENPAQDDPLDAPGMGFAVGEGERAPPAPAENDPTVDPEVLA